MDENTLDFVWMMLRPQIQDALQKGAGDSITEAWLYDQVKEKKFAMWVSHEGEHVKSGLILSIQDHPNKKTLFVELAAGAGLEDIAEYEGALIRAKELVGADTIETCCRKGFTKVLKNWRTKAYLMELL